MAEDKRIRVGVDTSPLRQLREEAISLYREINTASSVSTQENERNIEQLKEQLSLMESRVELERLLVDLKKQALSLENQVPQRPITPVTTPKEVQIPEEAKPRREESIVEEPIVEQPSEERQSLRESSIEQQKPSQRREEPIINQTENSITWDVSGPKAEPVKRPKPPVTREPVISEEGDSVSWNVEQPEKPKRKSSAREEERETLREINRHVENIDNSVTNVDNSNKTIDNSNITENNSEKTVNNTSCCENLRENITNIERNVETIRENTTTLTEKDPVEVRQPEREVVVREEESSDDKSATRSTDTSRQSETQLQQPLSTFDDANILRALSAINSSVNGSRKDIIDALKDFEKANSNNSSRTSINRYLDTISQSISMIEDNVDKLETEIVEVRRGGGSGGSGSTPTPGGGSGGSGRNSFSGMSIGRLLGTLGIAGTALSALKNIGSTLTDRYFRNQEADLRAEYQGTVETAANRKRVEAANEADMYRWIPIIGSTIARSIELPANIAADKMVATIQKYFDAENRNTLYTQTFGGTAGQSMQTAFREGGYAANSLGMDVSSFLQRNAELTRAAGGRALGSNEYDQYGWEERKSTLAAERLFGISSSATDKLQGSLRFGERNTNYGSSGIIRSFEKTMRELNMSFREIASTMEESMETFNKRADSILEKAGDFDAGKVAAVMNAVRAETSFSGRRLERFQEAYSGSGISQDEATQALLLRMLTKVNPGVQTYSEAMEKLEQVRSGDADSEFMRNFLLELKDLSQNNEQFINLLKSVFPNLSWQDIRRQFDFGKESGDVINRIFDRIAEDLKKLRETPNRAYEPTEAQQTVGTGARLQASDTNRQIGLGAKELRTLLEAIRDNTSETANNTRGGGDQRGKGTYFDENGPIYKADPIDKDANKPEMMQDLDKAVEKAMIRGFNKVFKRKIVIPEERE